METWLKNSKKSFFMGKNAKKFQKFVIRVPKNLAMTPKLGLKKWATAPKFGQKK